MGPVPPAPRTPSKRARRLIYRYTGSQAVLLMVGLGFTVIGGGVSIPFCWRLPGELGLTFAARQTSGTVLDAQLDPSVEINDEHPTRVRFRYSAAGVTHEGESVFAGEQPSAFAVGSEVDVEVLSFDPTVARIRGGTYSVLGLFGLLVVLFPCIGAVLWVTAVRSNRREVRAFEHGVPILADVTFAGLDTSAEINGKNPFKVAWAFGVQGRKYTGSISNMDRTELADLAQQQKITVLYDEAQPAINTVWLD